MRALSLILSLRQVAWKDCPESDIERVQHVACRFFERGSLGMILEIQS